MKTYKNQNEKLDIAIEELERKRNMQYEEIKLQLTATYESIKPINLIKQGFQDLKESPEVKSSLFQSLLSIAGGYISKKILIGKTNSIFKTILGYALQYGVTNFISKKVDSNSTNS